MLILLTLSVFAIVRFIRVKESETKKYYKAIESRRGSLRKAKERKKAIQFHQERHGATRRLFLENNAPIINKSRREFFLEAETADINLKLQADEYITIECFEKPRGWFQEELYWVLESTLERVIPIAKKVGRLTSSSDENQNLWVYESDMTKRVDDDKISEITPRQRIRYFDAIRAEWNFVTNVLTAHMISYCVVDIPGHVPTKVIEPNSILFEAEAETSVFKFQAASEGDIVVSTGVKLKLGSRNPSFGD